MVRSIKLGRLIELAEGKSAPTAVELRSLAVNPDLRKELGEYKSLFADLNNMPEPTVDKRALAQLLPSLRRRIESRTNPLVSWLQLRPVFSKVLAVAMSIMILVGFALLLEDSRPDSSEQFELFADMNGEQTLIFTADDTGELMAEASVIPELDLFPEMDIGLNNGVPEMLIDESTISLMESVTSDETIFALLEKDLKPEGDKFKAILKMFQSSDS